MDNIAAVIADFIVVVIVVDALFRRMVKKLCLGIEIAESEDEEFCIVDTM